jgi:uncharacterized protein (DUF58 family)
MTPSFLRWLEPRDLTRLAQLQFFARSVVEGLSGGIHRSHRKGASSEFQEHRPYVRGDELRRIDWKVFGKTDRLLVRQYVDETSLRCTLFVDQSGSMSYKGAGSDRPSKYDYATGLAASLAYLFALQGDAVGLGLHSSGLQRYIPPQGGPNHLKLILQELADSQAGQETDLAKALQDVLPRLSRRGVLILISDCFGDAEELVRGLATIRGHYQEVIVFQVMDDDEWDFPFDRRIQFQSLEDAQKHRTVDSASFRKTYLSNLERFQSQLSDGCRQHRIELVSLRTSQAIVDVLSQFVANRN